MRKFLPQLLLVIASVLLIASGFFTCASIVSPIINGQQEEIAQLKLAIAQYQQGEAK